MGPMEGRGRKNNNNNRTFIKNKMVRRKLWRKSNGKVWNNKEEQQQKNEEEVEGSLTRIWWRKIENEGRSWKKVIQREIGKIIC